MKNKALVVIDIQNDITKNYREIVENLNKAIDWAIEQEMYVVYICQNNITPSAKNFLPGTKGAEIVPELHVASYHIFIKTKTNALTSEAFCTFIVSVNSRPIRNRATICGSPAIQDQYMSATGALPKNASTASPMASRNASSAIQEQVE